jgi:prepilin peptidase CpaA
MDDWVGTLNTTAFVVLMLAAVAKDVKSRRIPNWLTAGGLVAALCLRLLMGRDSLVGGLSGAGLAALVSVPFFAIGALGGGDGKLLIAIGGFMGPARLVGALLMIALIGGALAVLDAYRRGILLLVWLNVVDLLKHLLTLGRKGKRIGLSSPGAVTIPYGVAIAVGSLVWWFWGPSM